jgi:hypothetical protein
MKLLLLDCAIAFGLYGVYTVDPVPDAVESVHALIQVDEPLPGHVYLTRAIDTDHQHEDGTPIAELRSFLPLTLICAKVAPGGMAYVWAGGFQFPQEAEWPRLWDLPPTDENIPAAGQRLKEGHHQWCRNMGYRA